MEKELVVNESNNKQNDKASNGELETVENEIETLTGTSGLITTSHEQVEDVLFLAENIDKLVAAHNKIKLAILRLSQPGDWILFKGDKIENAEVGFAGANRIGTALGVSYMNWEAKKQTGVDEVGEWYRWEFECDATFRGRVIRVYGRAGSRDKFFGKSYGTYKPIHELDEGNIKIAARRSAMKEGVKCLFGLHHMDPKYLKDNNVVFADVTGYEFKKKEEDAGTIEQVSTPIEKIGTKAGVKNGKPWTLYSFYAKNGVTYYTFDKKVYEEVKTGSDKGVHVMIDFKKTKFGFELLGISKNEEGNQG